MPIQYQPIAPHAPHANHVILSVNAVIPCLNSPRSPVPQDASDTFLHVSSHASLRHWMPWSCRLHQAEDPPAPALGGAVVAVEVEAEGAVGVEAEAGAVAEAVAEVAALSFSLD